MTPEQIIEDLRSQLATERARGIEAATRAQRLSDLLQAQKFAEVPACVGVIDITKLAREAGITIATWGGVRCGVPELSRFAALVRAAALTEAADAAVDAAYFGPQVSKPAAFQMAEAIRALAQQAGGEAPRC